MNLVHLKVLGDRIDIIEEYLFYTEKPREYFKTLDYISDTFKEWLKINKPNIYKYFEAHYFDIDLDYYHEDSIEII